MRNLLLFGLVIAAVLLNAYPLVAQCQMQYNISVYSDGDVSSDLSTVFGYSTTVDNSTLCSCDHSNYETTVSLYNPGGSELQSTQSGLESSVEMSTNNVMGTYEVIGTVAFYCSCAGNVGGGGPPSQVPVKPSVIIQVQQNFVSGAGNGLVLMGGPGGLTTTAITAVGQPGGGAVTWTAGPNLQVNGVNSANASVSGTAPSTSAGDTWISVQYVVQGGSAAASVRFTVLNPMSYQAANYPGGSQFTTGNSSGYITIINYFAYDQMSPPNPIQLPGVTNSELLQTVSNPFNAEFVPPDGTPHASGSGNNWTGVMPDQLYVILPGGLPPGFSASRNQSWTVNGYAFTPLQGQNYNSAHGTVTTQTFSRQ
jgi:hypothetical protein